MIEKAQDMKAAALLFGEWPETIIWSCLQGVMGEVFANRQEGPDSAMAVLGDFCFFAGKPTEEMVLYKPDCCHQHFIIMIPQNEEWAKVIETCYGNKARKVFRYAMKKEPSVFQKEKLTGILAALPGEYTVKHIDEEIFQKCKESDWSRDLVSQYKDYKTYCQKGLGVVVLKDGQPVSGASSYASYQGGIEIEIDTEEHHRRKGLAAACGALLILECLKRNLYPSWDAQNEKSVALAEKLGYHYSHTYTAYEIWGY